MNEEEREKLKEYERDDQRREHMARMRLKHLGNVAEIDFKTTKEINDELQEAANEAK